MPGFGDFLSNLRAPAPAPAAPQQQAPVTPDRAAPVAPSAAPTDVLANWNKLFEPAVAPPPGAPAVAPDYFAVSPENLAKAANNINMAQVISPELVTKALGGDQAAFMEALSKSSQMTFMMAYQAAMQATKGGLDQRFDTFQKDLPSTFKKFQVDSTLQDNPLFSNPALRPMVEGLRSQILTKHPDATPQQIDQAVTEYFKDIGAKFSSPAPSQNKSSGSTDWDNFLKA